MTPTLMPKAATSYLLRFDDICPTMNWRVWEAIEGLLTRHGLRPILAVVPDNRDPNLMSDPPAADFWDRVRGWQAKGYAIALHGYQHLYVNRERGLVGVTPHSEFTGLSYQEQEAKLRPAVAIFQAQGVRIDAWVAPSHSFDRTTLRVLRDLGIRVVSDGLWRWPHEDAAGSFWIPQQDWGLQERPAGTWTACFHHNDWTPAILQAFADALERYAPRMTDLAAVARIYAGRRLTLRDRAQAFRELAWAHRIAPALRRCRRRLGALGGGR